MTRHRIERILLFLVLGLAATEAPAPFIWRPDEGWSREGSERYANPDAAWTYAAALQEEGKHDEAIGAFRRILKKWPTASVAPRAQRALAESLEARNYYYKAYLEYQKLLDRYPEAVDFSEILLRQFDIGCRLFEGERQRVWKFRGFADVEKAAEIFEGIVRNGPYSDIAPRAQFGVGATWQKRKAWLEAADAYQKVADNYPDAEIAAEARYRLGICYYELSSGAHYDQDATRKSIDAFAAFLARHPDHPLAPSARQYTSELWERQAEGVYNTAAFYESRRDRKAAAIYYRKVLADYPETRWARQAEEALKRLEPEESPS